MLPAGLLAKAVQLCAAGLGTTASPSPTTFAVVVHTGAVLRQVPTIKADAVATVRDLVALGADFDAGPLGINGRDFAAYGVTPASVFDACALAHIDESDPESRPANPPVTVSSVTALLHRAFAARITDTIRPMNASYGAPNSWHKFGQAVDFVPAAGVGSITRQQIRALMDQSGVRLVELLGPGDRGHSNHWHIAFARPGQVVNQTDPVEGDEDWVVGVAAADLGPTRNEGADTAARPASALQPQEKSPPYWDVFAAAEWRAAHGGGL